MSEAELYELIEREKESLSNIITAISYHINLHKEIGDHLKAVQLDESTQDYKFSIKLSTFLDGNPDAFEDLNNVAKVFRWIGLLPPIRRTKKNQNGTGI